MSNPTNLSYTAEHEWIETRGDVARIGVTAFATEALGDIVFVELPEVGTEITGGEGCGELESTKSVSDLFAPADGEVVEINAAVVEDPGLINLDPFGAGWLFEMRVASAADLLDAAAYDALIEE